MPRHQAKAATASRPAYHSRGTIRPSFAGIFLNPPIRGRRECRMPVAPAASCALGIGRTHTSNNEYTGITRHSPRNGFTVSFVLSPAIGLFCHRHRRNCFHRLDTSVEMSGPHDFTVRSKPRRQRAATSTASRPDVRDVREPPLCVGRDIDGYRLIRNFGKSEYFYQRGFTDFWVICPTGRFVESLEEIALRKKSWPVWQGPPPECRSMQRRVLYLSPPAGRGRAHLLRAGEGASRQAET